MKYLFRISLVIFLSILFVSGCSENTEQKIKQLNTEAIKFLKLGNTSEAVKVGEKALALAEKGYGAEDPLIIKPLLTQAMLYQANKDFVKAEYSYKRAIDVVQKSSGENNIEAAKIINNLGSLYYNEKQYDKAISAYTKSLAIAEKTYAPEDPRLQKIRKNIETIKAIKSGKIPHPENNQGASKQTIHDLVPENIKSAAIQQLASQNIILSKKLTPMKAVKISDNGIVFPYRGLQRVDDKNEGLEVVVLFSAIKNQEKKDTYSFQQCRVVSYQSYSTLLNSGDLSSLQTALIQLFPELSNGDMG